MTHGEGVVAENVVDGLAIFYRHGSVGYRAFEVDLGGTTGRDGEGLDTFIITCIERCGYRVSGPSLGGVLSANELDALGGN